MAFFNLVNDASTAYANNYNYFISFQHIPTGMISQFKAFLTSFEDRYESSWNDVEVYGRMDPITTFQGTKRQIDFSFDVVAGDLREAKYNFEHSRRLIKSLYPVYEDAGAGAFSATSIQAPPLLRIRFVNLIASDSSTDIRGGLVGKLSGITYAPELEAGVFQAPNQVLPKVNKFNCSFTVLHTEPLGFNTAGRSRGDSRFPYTTTDTGGVGDTAISAALTFDDFEEFSSTTFDDTGENDYSDPGQDRTPLETERDTDDEEQRERRILG